MNDSELLPPTIKLYLLPIMLAKYGRGIKWYECKTSFEFVMCKNLPILFDIVAIAKLLLNLTFTVFSSSAAILLVLCSSNLLNDVTYQCVCSGNCVIRPDK